MFAVAKVDDLLAVSPSDEELLVLKKLCQSLDARTPFDVSVLAELSFENFNLAMDILRGWRTDTVRSSKRINQS